MLTGDRIIFSSFHLRESHLRAGDTEDWWLLAKRDLPCPENARHLEDSYSSWRPHRKLAVSLTWKPGKSWQMWGRHGVVAQTRPPPTTIASLVWKGYIHQNLKEIFVILGLLSLAPSIFLDTSTPSLLFCLKSLSTPDCSDERVKQFCLAGILRVKKQDCPTHGLFTYSHLRLYWPEKSKFQLPSADISFCKAHFQTAS